MSRFSLFALAVTLFVAPAAFVSDAMAANTEHPLDRGHSHGNPPASSPGEGSMIYHAPTSDKPFSSVRAKDWGVDDSASGMAAPGEKATDAAGSSGILHR